MKYIFITGMGRSGTTFLARMLERVPDATVRHEALGDREFWLLSWYLTAENYTVPYLLRARKDLEHAHSTAHFIDVNSYLQHAVPALRQVFEPVRVFHLVRDPREVIRSFYSRRSEGRLNVVPKNREDVEMWLDGDKFSRICWNWANTTRHLLEQGTEIIQFERLISDYSYFCDHLLTPFGFSLPERHWAAARQVRENKTRPRLYRFLYAAIKRQDYVDDVLKPYPHWSQDQKAVFTKICGETMKRAGYEL